jgi:hypothetical protein
MKKLNTDSITNELEHSSFFPGRPAQKPDSETSKAPAAQPAPIKMAETVVLRPFTEPAPTTRPVPSAVPASAPAGRRYIRRTFDFYEDQIAYLTRASLEDRLAGKEGSMNAMVREAVDLLIRERRRKEGSS